MVLCAPLMEVFPSIQGEGFFVGQPQVFVRLRGCPLRCSWCDTPASWALAPAGPESRARIQSADGSVRRVEGVASPAQVADWIAQAQGEAARPVSLTGGEPLLWPEFILGLTASLDVPLHLETAGAHPAALERVLPRLAHVSLDLKLPQDLDPPVGFQPGEVENDGPLPATHGEWRTVRRQILPMLAEWVAVDPGRAARGESQRTAAQKIILSGGRSPSAFEPLLKDVRDLAPHIPVILQPVTPVAEVRAPSRAEIFAVLHLAESLGLTARVLPQVHRALDLP